MTIYDYVKKYKYTFEEKEFNEVDNLVFSLISYVDFNEIVENEKIILKEAVDLFNSKYKKKDFKYDLTSIKTGNKILNLVKESPRFKDILLYNYEYIGNEEEQFSALTFEINKKLVYIAFEGTDKLLSGWEEDAKMCYLFPVPAHKSAIKYLNKNFTFSNKKLIIGGHSKGGNLALVSSMYANIFVRNKILKIYSNDGQGLRKKEIESKNYKRIKNRYTHIIPYNSIVGILLRHEPFSESTVIDSSLPMFLSHSASSWKINNTSFIRRNISERSIKIDHIISNWLNKYDYETRRLFVEDIFNVMKKNDINDLSQIKKNYFKLIKIIKTSTELSPNTKKMFNDIKDVIKELDTIMENKTEELEK